MEASIRVGSTAKQADPTISSIKLTGGKHVISGSLSSKASSTLYVELFATSDGEGKTLIGAALVKTGGDGKATWTLQVEPLAEGTYVTATATAADGSTSEFANALMA